jgi:hypothetical protein
MSWFKIIFYAVIIGLGFYLVSLLRKLKNGEVPEALLPPNAKVKDGEAFGKMLMPSGIIFTVVTFLFGIEGYLSAFGVLKFLGKTGNKIIDVLIVLVFFVAFGFFYSKMHEAISKYVR